MVTVAFVPTTLLMSPITSDFSMWYAPSSVTALGTILAMAAWSFRAALGGRRVWRGELLES